MTRRTSLGLVQVLGLGLGTPPGPDLAQAQALGRRRTAGGGENHGNTQEASPVCRLVPQFLEEKCMDCGGCVGVCPHDALDLFQGFITVRDACTECDLCVRICPVEAFVSVKTA